MPKERESNIIPNHNEDHEFEQDNPKIEETKETKNRIQSAKCR